MSIKELDSRVATLRELQTEADRIAAEIEAIKDQIKQTMIDQGSETLTGADWKASWKIVESTRFDSKALKAADPATYDRFTVATRTSRFILN